jgi:phosphatidylserine/phosphatidylglycerophosphate/cardiolipin synthase-like enzyme
VLILIRGCPKDSVVFKMLHYNTLFGPHPLGIIKDYFNKAEKSINIFMFNFDSLDLLTELFVVASKKPDLHVTIVVDRENLVTFFEHLRKLPSYEACSPRIAFFHASKMYFHMLHVKTAFIDLKIELSGSYNYTDAAKLDSIESLTVFDDDGRCKFLFKLFSVLAEGAGLESIRSVEKLQRMDNQGLLLDSEIENGDTIESFIGYYPTFIVSPIDGKWECKQPRNRHPRVILCNVFANAKKTISVFIHKFDDAEIATALAKAKARGVSVVVIVQYADSDLEKPDHYPMISPEVRDILNLAGVNIREVQCVGTSEGNMHLKVAFVDSLIECSGSFNYTYAAGNNALSKKRDKLQLNLLSVLRDPDHVTKTEKQFLEAIVLKVRLPVHNTL